MDAIWARHIGIAGRQDGLGGADLTSEGTTVVATTASALALTPFPDSPRVHYTRNPLIEVICQVRFPPILRIDSEVPAQFQEMIREAFPLFREEDSPLLPELSPELSQIVRASLQQQLPRKSWKFTTEDMTWEVTLTRESYTLSTTTYRRWEEFRARFEIVLGALQSEYRPSFITRIGLRYQNLIVRSRLGLSDSSWADLLQPHITAEYSSLEISPAIQEAVHRVLIGLSGNGKVNLRHGTARKDGEDEIVYFIDNDFFTDDKTEVASVTERLDHFNRDSGRLFRWCISERLHEAMGPTHESLSGNLARPDI
jgi:uncharacterized protein (TIGR04255 family)